MLSFDTHIDKRNGRSLTVGVVTYCFSFYSLSIQLEDDDQINVFVYTNVYLQLAVQGWDEDGNYKISVCKAITVNHNNHNIPIFRAVTLALVHGTEEEMGKFVQGEKEKEEKLVGRGEEGFGYSWGVCVSARQMMTEIVRKEWEKDESRDVDRWWWSEFCYRIHYG